MIAVVRGNDFRLRIPIRRNVVHNNGTTSYEPLDISALNDLHVFLEDETMCAKELSWFIDTENASSIIADVPACMQEGKYALILLGKYSDDRRFRSKERKQLRLVETNEKANVTPFDLDGFDAYALDTMIVMDGRGRDGLTAYEIAVAHGYEGTEEEWIESLHNVSDADKERWNHKQDTLTFDNLPTQGSNNPVKSGGVYSKIQDLTTVAQLIRDDVSAIQQEMPEKQNVLTFDNTPTANSNNPVKSGGVANSVGICRIANGSNGNLTNPNAIHTEVIKLEKGAKYVIFRTDRPNNIRCEYAYGYVFTDSLEDIGEIGSKDTFVGNIISVDYSPSLKGKNYIEIPSGYVGVTFTLAEYDSSNVESQLRITDFSNSKVEIISSEYVEKRIGITEQRISDDETNMGLLGERVSAAELQLTEQYTNLIENKNIVSINDSVPQIIDSNVMSIPRTKLPVIDGRSYEICSGGQIPRDDKSFIFCYDSNGNYTWDRKYQYGMTKKTITIPSGSSQILFNILTKDATKAYVKDLTTNEIIWSPISTIRKKVDYIEQEVDSIKNDITQSYDNVTDNKCIGQTGGTNPIISDSDVICIPSDKIPITGGHNIEFCSGGVIPNYLTSLFAFIYDSTGNYTWRNKYQFGRSKVEFTAEQNDAFLMFNILASAADDAYVKDITDNVVLWTPKGKGIYGEVQDIKRDITDIEGDISDIQDEIGELQGTNVLSRNQDKVPMLVNSCRWHKTSNSFKDFQVAICTDMHTARTANQNIIKATNGFPYIDAYINCGDIVGSNYIEPSVRQDFITDFNTLTKPGFVVIGNHDVGNAFYVGVCCNHQQAYNAYIKPMVDKGFLVSGEYEAGNPYWYHDISTYKIRLIGLYEYDDNLDLEASNSYWEAVTYDSSKSSLAYNTAYNIGDIVNAGDYTSYSFKCIQAVTTPTNWYTNREKLPCYRVQRGARVIRQTQAQWFLDTLASTPTEYGVIVITHNPFSDTAVSIDKKFSWPSGITGSRWTQSNMTTNFIRNAIVAFKSGSNYSEKIVMSGDASYLNTLNDGTINYAYEVSKDFSANNSGVYVLGILGGHCHRDIIWKDATENIYQVSPNCARVDGANDSNGDVRRTNTDGLSHDSITCASFATERVGLVKLGVNVTERGTFRDYEVIDTSV